MKLIFILLGLILLFTSCDTMYVVIREEEPEPPLCIADYINTEDYFEGTAYVFEFEFDNSGDIWLTTYMGILEVSQSDFSTLNIFNSSNSILEDDQMGYLSVDKDNNIWISGSQELYRYNQANKTFQVFDSDKFEHIPLSKVYVAPDNNLYVTDNYNLFQFIDNDWKLIFDIHSTGVKGIYINTSDASVAKENNTFWLATTEGLLKYENSDSWTLYNTNNSGITDNIVQKIRIDNGGNKWIEIFSGIEMFDNDNWFLYDELNTIEIADEFIIGNSSRPNRILRFEDNQWDYFLLGYFDAPNKFKDAKIDDEGHLWLSNGSNLINKLIINP